MSAKLRRAGTAVWLVIVTLAIGYGAVEAVESALAEPCGTYSWQLTGICPDENACQNACRNMFGGPGYCEEYTNEWCCECQL